MLRRIFSSLFRITILTSALGMMFFVSAAVPAMAAPGDGMIVYGDGTNTTPFYRTWTSATSTWGVQTAAQPASATINFAVMKSSTTEAGRRTMATLSTAASNNLNVQRWNGSAWSLAWSVTNSQNSYRGVDVAYECLSGRAMVAYGKGDGNIYYRIWTPSTSTWSAEASTSLATGVGTIRWVRLVPKLNSNEIAVVVVGSNTTGNNVNAKIWDGSSWGNEPSGGLGLDSQNGYDSMDAAYETNVGVGRELMVAWATASSTPFWAYATLVGTTWTKVTNPSALSSSAIYQMSLASSPLATSNLIVIGVMADGSVGKKTEGKLSLGRWSGSAWTLQTDVATACSGFLSHDVDAVFCGTTDTAIIIYADNTGGGNVVYARSVAGGAFSMLNQPGGPGGRKYIISCYSDANTSKIMEIQVDSQQRIFVNEYNEATQTWNLGSGSNPLSTASSGGTGDNSKESLVFSYDSVYSVPALGWWLLLLLIIGFSFVAVRKGELKLNRAES